MKKNEAITALIKAGWPRDFALRQERRIWSLPEEFHPVSLSDLAYTSERLHWQREAEYGSRV